MDDELIILALIVAVFVLFRRVAKLKRKTDELAETVGLLRQGQAFAPTQTETPNPFETAQRPAAPEVPDVPEPALEREPAPPSNDVPDYGDAVANLPIDDGEPAVASPLLTEPSASIDESLDIPTPPKYRPPANNGDGWTDRLEGWLKENWFYAISAVCLGLAGIFLIIYGVERGLLTPTARVAAALALGAILIMAGEVIRRRFGDDAASHTAYLPSTLSGAGVIVLFAAILGARYLYGLIGADTSFMALVAVSVGTVVLGWVYGPVLTAIGLVGATLTPFIVGGSSDSPEAFFYYFALIALTGLGIDTMKQWLWPSILGLVCTYAAALLLYLVGADDPHFIAFALLVALGALTIPYRQLQPAHDGPMLGEVMYSLKPLSLKPPTLIAMAACLAAFASVTLVALLDRGMTEFMTAMVILVLLQVMVAVWLRPAHALTDLNLVAPVLYLAILGIHAVNEGSLFQHYLDTGALDSGMDPMPIVLGLAGVGVLGSALALWRATQPTQYGLYWAYGMALFAPLVLVVLELTWKPTDLIGSFAWGGMALGLAALMTIAAGQLSRVDGEERGRVALAALAAVGMLSFALIILLTEVALTVALAITIALAVLADKRFNLPLMSIFVQIGVVVVSARLVLLPGIDWAVEAPLPEVLLAFGGSLAALFAAWWQLSAAERPAARTVTESVLLSVPAIFVVIMLFRALDGDVESHAVQGLFACTFLIASMAQVYRLPVSEGWLYNLRYGLALIFGFLAASCWLGAIVVYNPLVLDDQLVRGPVILDTLFVAYVLPALVLAGSLRLFPTLRSEAQRLVQGVVALSVVFYLGLETRRFWRGDILSVPGTTDPELYSYTVLLLFASTALLLLAYFRRSVDLYRLALAAVAITLAKAFLVDMAGLEGLLRVVSFLGLGLVLAGLAWLNNQIKPRLQAEIEQPG